MTTSRARKKWGWALYDWANSAFATTVMAGFFPVFFKQYWNAGLEVTESTFRLGVANSIASLVIVLMAPVLGAIARVILENGWEDKEWIKNWVNDKWGSSSGFGQGTRNTMAVAYHLGQVPDQGL